MNTRLLFFFIGAISALIGFMYGYLTWKIMERIISQSEVEEAINFTHDNI